MNIKKNPGNFQKSIKESSQTKPSFSKPPSSGSIPVSNNNQEFEKLDFGTTSVISYDGESLLLSRNEMSLSESKASLYNNSISLKGGEQESLDLRSSKKFSEQGLNYPNNIKIESSSLNYQKKNVSNNKNCYFKEEKKEGVEKDLKTIDSKNENVFRKKIDIESLLSNYELKNSNEEEKMEDMIKENKALNNLNTFSIGIFKDNNYHKINDFSSAKFNNKPVKSKSYSIEITEEEYRCKPNPTKSLASENNKNKSNEKEVSTEKENVSKNEQNSNSIIKTNNAEKGIMQLLKTNLIDIKEVKEDSDVSNYKNFIELINQTKKDNQHNPESENETFIKLLDKIKEQLLLKNKKNDINSNANESLFPTFAIREEAHETHETPHGTIDKGKSRNELSSPKTNDHPRNLSTNTNYSYTHQQEKQKLGKINSIGRTNSVSESPNRSILKHSPSSKKKNLTQKNLNTLKSSLNLGRNERYVLIYYKNLVLKLILTKKKLYTKEIHCKISLFT